ncbi:MAG: chitobiase/beta-hexosaminidase C-terminal domain-containing protein [Prevotella sp.]|nr:chitobiase/beta-hexosaminidase C-terminal domain-containing protein [Prevotella sp.]
MSKILYEVYQNDIKDSESAMYGKWYARLKSIETLSLTKLAKHIAEHGSVFTPDLVYAVIQKFKTCLLEMLLESKKVKVAGLGTFYLTAECEKGGAEKEADFNVNQHLKALHIRFLPDQTAEDNISSREFIKKAEFVNVKSLLSSGNSDEDGGDSGNGGTDGGSEQSGSGDSGSSSQNSGSEAVTAPEISGTSPFTDSTQVTIQGPQGAAIYYTTDGSTPTSESMDYSEPITLSATTTVKAIAILNGETSAVSSKTFTKSGESGGFDLGN